MTLQEIIEKHGIDVFNENVVIVGRDGTIALEENEGELEVTVSYPDRMVVDYGFSVAELIDEEGE